MLVPQFLLPEEKVMDFQKGDRVVWCPDSWGQSRGAMGEVIDITRKGSKGNKKVKAVLVRWITHRRGVSNIIIRGKPGQRDYRLTEDEDGRTFQRIPEPSKGCLRKLSFCDDCPLRLRKLISQCPTVFSKKKLIKERQQHETKSH